MGISNIALGAAQSVGIAPSTKKRNFLGSVGDFFKKIGKPFLDLGDVGVTAIESRLTQLREGAALLKELERVKSQKQQEQFSSAKGLLVGFERGQTLILQFLPFIFVGGIVLLLLRIRK